MVWSEIREGDGALLSLATGKDAAGSEIIAALTPSGGLVIGGDPAEDRRQWQIRVW
jgi:hypothetical protein